MRKLAMIVCICIVLVPAAFCKNYIVHTQQEFNTALTKVSGGDKVVIANGTYTDWAVVVPVNGNAASPVTIAAETPGKVTFTGTVTKPVFQITGSYTVLSGLTFSDCTLQKGEGGTGVLIELKNTLHSRLTHCVFTRNTVKVLFTPLVIISGKGQYNDVDNCSFISNIDNQEVQVKITKDECPTFTTIQNNIFKDKSPVSWKVFNGGECVQVGQDPVLRGTAEAKATVRNNRFIRCNGEAEVISNKSSGNSYIKNYFEDCEGELVMRGGHDCVIDSNVIKGGTGGIRINGTGHKVTNNSISNVKTGIRLMYGMAKGKDEIGFYISASDCTISHNVIENATTAILIGDSKNADWTGKFDTVKYPSRVFQDVAPFNNQVGDNTFTNCIYEVVTN